MLNYTLCTVKPIMIIVNCVKSEHSCSSTTCTLLCMLQSKPNTLHSTTSASLPVGPSSVYLARIKKQPGEVHQNVLAEKHLFTNIYAPYAGYDKKTLNSWHLCASSANILNKIVAASFWLVPKTQNTLHHEAKTIAAKGAFFIQKPWCMKTINASRSKRSRTKMDLGILLL